ncbi:MAG: hypothetical protein RIR65_1307 [Planctomycetota bacterium]
MIRTLVALFVLCSATAWAQEAGATAAEKAVARYPDLKKLASGALDAERDAWLKEQGLKLGPDNRDGLWILWAQASISAPTTSDAWGKARLAAFAEARLKAETNFIRETGVKIEVETLRDYFADDSLRDPRNLEVKGHEERLRDKVAQVGEAMLDKALAELEAKPAAGASLEDKRTLLKKTLRRVSFKQASGRVSGMRIMTTLEGTSANGGTNVGVILAWSRDNQRLAEAIASGRGMSDPKGAAAQKTLAERIPNDAEALYDRLGVRVLVDEKGDRVLVGYGQAAPLVATSMSEERMERVLEAAREMAYDDALANMADFLNATLVYQSQVERTAEVEDYTAKYVQDGVSYEEEGTVRNFVDTIHEQAKRRALVTIKGSSRFLDWQGNHPDHGHPIVGCVVVWSPSTAKAAADAQRGGAAGGVQGYDAKGGTPGVRRSREDEGGPQGAGATGGAGSIGCDGVEAVGVGLDRASAVLEALQEAVRQANGVKISSDRVVSLKFEDAVTDMASSFRSQSLSAQDISVRTAGLVQSYEVLGEVPEPSGGKIRVTLCARIPRWDPDNPRPGARPTLVVLPPTAARGSYTVMGGTVGGVEATRMLEAEMGRDLFKTRAFTLLERDRLQEIVGEQALIASSLSDVQEQIKLGRMLGADYLLLSSIQDLHADREEKTIQLTGRKIVKRHGTVVVDWRLVSVATGEVRDTDQISLALDEESFAQLQSRNPGAQVAPAILSACSQRLATELGRRASPVVVVHVAGDEVFLNRGMGAIAQGEEFEVWRQGKQLVDPQSGRKLGSADSKVALVRVARVEGDYSVARLVSGEVGPADAGAVCRAPRP